MPLRQNIDDVFKMRYFAPSGREEERDRHRQSKVGRFRQLRVVVMQADGLPGHSSPPNIAPEDGDLSARSPQGGNQFESLPFLYSKVWHLSECVFELFYTQTAHL